MRYLWLEVFAYACIGAAAVLALANVLLTVLMTA